MVTRVKIIVLSLGLFLACGFFLLYQFLGFKYYLRALHAAHKLPGRAVKAADVIHGTGSGGWMGGILAGVNKNAPGGVWFWGRRGLQYLRADEYSVFSFYDICDDYVLSQMELDRRAVVERSIDTDIKVWAEKVKPGDYVVVLATGAGHGEGQIEMSAGI